MKRVTHPEATQTARDAWRQPPTHLMSAAELAEYIRRKGALDAYLDGTRVRLITEETGLTRSALVRMAERALFADDTGLPLGYYACVKHARAMRPSRKAHLDPGRAWRNRGLACEMRRIAHISPEVEDFLERTIESDKWRSRKARKTIFARFKTLVTKADPTILYPFCNPDEGWGSLFRYLGREAERRGNVDELQLPKVRTKPLPGDNSGLPSAAWSRNIYDEVEFDGFIQPIDMEILLPSEFQIDTPVRLEGLGLLAAVERKSTTVIGYYPLFKTSYDGLDVISCMVMALEEWKPRNLTIPVFSYLPDAALPSGAHPDAIGRMWNLLFWDNHRAQVAPMARDALIHATHCDINEGRAGEPTARPCVERFFGDVSQLNLRGLLEKRQLRPIAADQGRVVTGAIPLSWVLDLFDIICANHNVTSKKTLNQRKPLDVLLDELRREDGWGRKDSSETAAWRRMNYITVRLPIHRVKGRAPYVNFESAQYSSEILRDYANDPRSGNAVDAEIYIRDLRDIKATGVEGLDLKILHARSPWQSAAPCDIQTRRLIARARRREGIPMHDINEDAQARFTRQQLALASESRASGSTVATMALRGSMAPSAAPRKRRLSVPRGGWIDIDEI